MIKLKDLIKELSYKGNLGIMELVEFYKRATDDERLTLERLMNAKKWNAAWKLIQQVTKTKLVGFPQRMPDTPPPGGAFGWSQPTSGGGGAGG